MLRWFAPAGLAVLVMLPRLASARFGLLDDGLTLQTGREVIGRWSSVLDLIPETGRFFPAYWLAYSGVFALVGVRAAAFFALNVLLLAGLLALLARIVRASGGTSRQAALAAVLFALCAPAIEAFYTLSKAEPLQLTWICASLLTTAAAVRESWWWRRGVLIGLAVAALVLAYATKETTAILVPVSLAWAAIEWWAGRQPGWTRFANTYVVVTGAAAAVFIVLRWRYAALPLAEGTYTRAYALEPGALAAAMFRISAWMVRDFAFLLPLLAAAIVLVLRGGPDRRRQILYACAWMGGWLAVYAPWPATFAYYLLPFAFGAAILAGIVIGALWELGVSGAPVLTRRLARAALLVSGLLWLPAVINAATDARVQLAVDWANADLVDFLGGVPSGSRVVVNTTRANEYLYELPLHLAEIKRRPDLVVQHVGAPVAGGPSRADVFVATATMANQPGPTVRIALDEAGVTGDNARLAAILGEGSELVYTTEQRVRLLEVGIHRLLCPVAVRPFIDTTYCPSHRGLVDVRTFSYGWRVHRLARRAVERAPSPT